MNATETTPTAAEVMGWQAPWVDAGGKQMSPPEGPTPDDMREWLNGQPCSVWAGEDNDTPLLLSGKVVTLHVINDRNGENTRVTATTLHAALEAAVIAVGRDR